MTELERRLLEAGDALADAVERNRRATRMLFELDCDERRDADEYKALHIELEAAAVSEVNNLSAYRALAREVKESSDDT